jgi:glutamate dehydrogenase (NAD(P)+)
VCIRGVGILASKLIRRLGRKPENVRTAVQGFGNVGSHAVKFLHESAFPVVAVSDVSGCYYNPKGLDVPDLLRHTLKNSGSLKGYENAELLSGDELLTLDIDMLIPAALGGVIHDGNVDKI